LKHTAFLPPFLFVPSRFVCGDCTENSEPPRIIIEAIALTLRQRLINFFETSFPLDENETAKLIEQKNEVTKGGMQRKVI
jgi:hypothetical protein